VEICVRNMGIVAAFWRSQPPFCNGPLRSNAKTAKALGLTVPELLVEAVTGSCDRPRAREGTPIFRRHEPRLATGVPRMQFEAVRSHEQPALGALAASDLAPRRGKNA
jgi:hypothetical protein